ncbi:MAG TPA: hypothetical protein VF584_11410 [Longimicrobium sp.]|jgi:hypothetical protein
MNRAFVRPVATALLCLPVLNGCFAYAPAAGGDPPAPSRVRVLLTRPMDVRLTNVTANNVAVAEGEVVSTTRDTLTISALWLRAGTGYEFPGAGETVRIPREQVGRIETRRFSAARSVGVAVLSVGLGALLFAGVGKLTGSGDGGGGRPNPS